MTCWKRINEIGYIMRFDVRETRHKDTTTVYYKGTLIYVKYRDNDIIKRRVVLLAETFEEGMAFQVVEAYGYDAGVVWGFIPSENDNAKCLSRDYLIQMFGRYIFHDIIKFRVLNNRHRSKVK